MGRAEAGTPKAISNQIKSKGLQKLRWYCQMCQKQCRDENGYKCHLTSESHRRQMNLFGEDPEDFIDNYSKEFQNTFLEHLRISHPGTRVSAKVLYNEYISNRHHIHMTSTQWYTLTEFVKHLGRIGKCKVDETPKGWFVQLIQKDPFEDMKEKNKRKRETLIRAEEEDQQKLIQQQYERAKQQLKTDTEERKPTELVRDQNDGPINISLALQVTQNQDAKKQHRNNIDIHKPLQQKMKWDENAQQSLQSDESEEDVEQKVKNQNNRTNIMEQILIKNQKQKQNLDNKKIKNSNFKQEAQQGQQQSDAWITKHLIVKIQSAKLKEHGYYGKKGKIIEIVSSHIAEIEMLDSQDLLRVHQKDLETVIPNFGQTVKILAGKYKGETGKLQQISQDEYKGQIDIDSIQKEFWTGYDNFCKILL